MNTPRKPVVPGFDDGTVFRTLFAAYPDALLVVDQRGVIVLANPTALELLGYTADELVGMSVDTLVPDATRPRHAAYREGYATHPRKRPMGTQMDLVAKRRDGSEVMVEIALSPLNDHGLPLVVAAIRSVASYPRVQHALQRARYAEHLAQFSRHAVDVADLHLLLDQVPVIAAEALQVETAKVLLLEPNGAEFRIAAGVGLLPEEAIGDRIANEAQSPSGHVMSSGQSVLMGDYAAESRFTIPSHYLAAGFVCEITVPLADRGRTIGVLSVRSRTARRFGDEEVRFLESLSSLLATVLQRTQIEEALGHAQRLESVGQLTGGIAHDFNNLLTVISGNLQVLEDSPAIGDDAVSQQLIGAAMRATRRGAELTGKLLAFSRRQVLQPTIVDTRALLLSLTDMLRRTLDQRIAITLVADAALCMADAGQLESALLNIAINSRDAMPQGGTLTFSCRVVSALPADLRSDHDTQAQPPVPTGYVAIAVSDTGDGMPESVQERAFEPFFTTKEAGRGTGLGLSTVYGFAKQSHGAVKLVSAPGAGTTVTLFLPRAEDDDYFDYDSDGEDAADDDSIADVTHGAVPHGLRVMLVEDDAEVRSVLQKFLASMGCEAVACGQAEQALASLMAGSAIDLLLTDIALGVGMQGTELAAKAHALRPALAVLLMSGFSSELADAPPDWELLPKPCTRLELERAMLRALSAAPLPPTLPTRAA
ncbi:PAS domain S-box protein [Variovorax sp. RTB1]|uniref:PAS domain S-box protein n=1 Tax=Variovorax sp. RTB1 TaxID=3048631 RepID=UPI002B234EC7|nr:PAS domain S-box protein [Variovorax sp. RTB1]MEB0112708.1 PAS domain S-box protein [Variovorax sp. RTB1]